MSLAGPLLGAVVALGLVSAAALIALFWRGSRGLRGSALVGSLARVSVAIPERGTGAIAHVRCGRRATLPARSCEAGVLERGAWVVVVDIERRTAIVRPVPPELQEVFQ